MSRRTAKALLLSAPWIAALLLGGCASSDLSGDAGINEEVAICLPPGTPAPVQVDRAMWFPNAGGVGSTDASIVHVSGVLALAGSKLWFMAWNDQEHHFDMLHTIDLIQAEKMSIDRLGTSTMLVVRSGNDLLDSFQLMGKGELSSDAKATEGLLAGIEALRARNPQENP